MKKMERSPNIQNKTFKITELLKVNKLTSIYPSIHDESISHYILPSPPTSILPATIDKRVWCITIVNEKFREEFVSGDLFENSPHPTLYTTWHYKINVVTDRIDRAVFCEQRINTRTYIYIHTHACWIQTVSLKCTDKKIFDELIETNMNMAMVAAISVPWWRKWNKRDELTNHWYRYRIMVPTNIVWLVQDWFSLESSIIVYPYDWVLEIIDLNHLNAVLIDLNHLNADFWSKKNMVDH